MGNILRDFRRIIYNLRRKYGFRFDFYRPVETINYTTGLKTTVRTKYPIKNGIILPSAAFRDYNYASLLQGTMPSQYNGIIDVTLRRIIIDKKEFPNNFVLSVNDYVVINHRRYQIKQISEMEIVDFLSVIIKSVEGEQPFEVHDIYYDDFIKLSETLNGEEPVQHHVMFPQSIVDYPYNPFLVYENLEDMEEL